MAPLWPSSLDCCMSKPTTTTRQQLQPFHGRIPGDMGMVQTRHPQFNSDDIYRTWAKKKDFHRTKTTYPFFRIIFRKRRDNLCELQSSCKSKQSDRTSYHWVKRKLRTLQRMMTKRIWRVLNLQLFQCFFYFSCPSVFLK